MQDVTNVTNMTVPGVRSWTPSRSAEGAVQPLGDDTRGPQPCTTMTDHGYSRANPKRRWRPLTPPNAPLVSVGIAECELRRERRCDASGCRNAAR